MSNSKECLCLTDHVSVDFSTNLEETEDLEEIDEDELYKDEKVPHNIIWQEISDKFDSDRSAIEEYKLSKFTTDPAIEFLERTVFPLLASQILEATLNRTKELNCIKHQKNAFNGVDFIAEMLWNLNPKYPHRKSKWTYIFDMDWVEEWLKEHPREFYPFSWIWSQEYAATNIQAAVRGHWVRCREDVQEMRQFWKTLAKEREAEPSEIK